MKFVDPNKLFVTEPPVVPVVSDNMYSDKTERGMSTYLQILPSVGLYGFQFEVYISDSNKVLDGNFRTYAGRELGLLVPVSVQSSRHCYNIWLKRIIIRIRLLFKRNWLFYKKIRVNRSASNSSLVCLFQKNILEQNTD